MKWFIKVLKNYANFKGRARRKEYWMFYLFSLIISLILGGIEGFSGTSNISDIYSFAVIIPTIAVGVRRMHDQGKSGWYLLIPIYNLVLLCTNGDVGPNEYGEDPKDETFSSEDTLDSAID